MRLHWTTFVASALLTAVGSHSARAGDWPQWRYDAARSAASPDNLPTDLQLRWTRQLPAPRPAWPASQPSLRFDTSYEPVAAEGLLFVPSMVTDTVTAYDGGTGREVWRFFADGPVRLAPCYGEGKLYFGSDDGYLYCVTAADGKLQWKTRGGPSDRRILGNERLISTWPVRGGPVLHQGVVYFSAGIWPFMGIFVHAIDAETGASIWTNSGDSITYQTNPHSSAAFGGFVPRGHMAITDDGLLAPGGRTPPGTYDLRTGKLVKFLFAKQGSRSTHGPKPIRVGSRTFTPGEGRVETDGWQHNVDGNVWTLLAADEKLFAVTTGGKIYCFGEGEGDATHHAAREARPSTKSGPLHPLAEAIVDRSGVKKGYALMLGLGTGSLAGELIDTSDVHLIVVDPNAKYIGAFRRLMIELGLYGTRVTAHVGHPITYSLPPYFASLIVSENPADAGADLGEPFAAKAYRSLRPYGGVACLPVNAERIKRYASEAKLANARVESLSDLWSMLRREGPLPGAADWTHNYADAANSVVSNDTRAKLPLGLLWFGGPSNDEVLPRHGHGPSPQVAAGRLVIEGADMLRAIDIYTGRLLWQRQLPGLGEFYNHTGHQPGAGEIGSNYVTLPDAVYVIHESKILRLDPQTGNTVDEIALEPSPDGAAANWGSIRVVDDLLVATSTPVRVKEAGSKHVGESLRDSHSSVSERPNYAKEDASQPAPDSHAVITPNETWRYLAGSDPADAWTDVAFDDSAWKTGAAGFGYGDGDDRTTIDMQGKFTRVYIRKTFDAAAAGGAAAAVLRINYDDGFIAYLNGREIARAAIAKGRGKGVSRVSSHEAEGHETFDIKDFASQLKPGNNVLAIEGHNRNLASSDFSLDPSLWVQSNGKTPAADPKPPKQPDASPLAKHFTPVRYSSASRRLVVMDRADGRVLWDRRAAYGWRHNNIAVAAGKVFCIDGLSPLKRAALKRRGLNTDDYRPQLLALDVRTGDVVWSTTENVFGTFLNYSTEHDVLLQAGSNFRDRASDEVGSGMVAYQGSDGRVLWQHLDRAHAGPCLLHGDTIIAQGPAYSLLTGEPKTRVHPLTHQEVAWRFTRNYGCNTAIAGRNLLTFRSAAAGFCDLAGDGGTGNFGGFKSSCTSNLIIAGGLLNAPEYTRTCKCNYQNQTSLAMIHDPDVETWTFNALDWDGSPVQQAGINFGAPGDRRDARGVLWMDYPSDGGPSPDLPVTVSPGSATYHRQHGSLLEAGDDGAIPWVAASGILGAREIRIGLCKRDDAKPRKYRVRLHFAELRGAEPGERVFDVFVQDAKAIERLDVAARVGKSTPLVCEVADVEVADELRVRLVPCEDTPDAEPIVCGVEVEVQE